MDTRWTSPFTKEQILHLIVWQASSKVHPYTCPNDGSDLVPMDRWVCALCDYEQHWAHAFIVRDLADD